VASAFLPAECINRKKQGFEIPLRKWMGNEWMPYVETLLDKGLYSYGILSRKGVQDLMQSREPHHNQLWTLLVLKTWLSRWFA
jgi:asparagine synthase (glutamine-hydrolysing)